MRAAVVVCVLAMLAGAAHAQEQPSEFLSDYDPSSKEWNGLYTFTRTAAGVGLEVLSVSSLEWNASGFEITQMNNRSYSERPVPQTIELAQAQ